MDHINLFQTNTEFNAAYNGSSYVEPWVSYTMETSGMSFNKEQTPPSPYLSMPLTFEFFGSGTLLPNFDIEYSIDNGQTWNDGSYSDINVNNGTKVLFRGDTDGNMTSSSMFRLTGDSCYFNMYGNIMSIINSTGFTTATTLQPGQGFMCMFADGYGSYGADKLLSAENLILPATTLSEGCYNNMFWQCSSLTGVPALPATTLAEGCYGAMFKECTSLTTAPELPATTLASYCYQCMFDYCTSLTTAPELPATTLADFCYNEMFQSCSNLNYIKCLATDISANDCTYNWVNGVSSTGTFVKNANMSSWTTGDDGIPANWTVQDAS